MTRRSFWGPQDKVTYKGRFAPSPTGPLHLGSLTAALGSYLDARSNHGEWHVRLEDIDPPRDIPEAKVWIPRQLEDHGLHWDKEISCQSKRLQLYGHFLKELEHSGDTFYCTCTRQRIKTLGGHYDGNCRSNTTRAQKNDSAIRVKLEGLQTWKDLVQGHQSFSAGQLNGDFIVRRRDGLFSYQLAVAIDDSIQKISHVIRGADLIDSTARQIYLHNLLGLKSPQYGHLPVVMNRSGQKLSKQNLASSLDDSPAQENLIKALDFLGQQPGRELQDARVDEILCWATANWALANVPTALDPRY